MPQAPTPPAAPKKGRWLNFAFAAVILAVALGWLALRAARSPSGPRMVAELTYGTTNPVTVRIPLDHDETYDFDTGEYTIHLQVKDGSIAFVNSPCPDHLCEGFGWLSEQDAWAACLPAQAALIVGQEQ